MEDFNLLRKLNRVSAPADFERRVLAQLAQKRAALPQIRRARAFRFSLAGAAVALLISFVILNFFVFEKSGPAQFAGQNARNVPGLNEVVPITETMDYWREVRNASYEPRTVYILEQVSDASNTLIKY
jgi:hypothetical protein